MKIAITGPESTGKSTLSKKLAEYFDLDHCEEFARSYLEGQSPPYAFEELEKIAKGQVQLWEEMNGDFITDTEMTVMKVWSQLKFGKQHTYIVQAFEKQDFDLYLLCYPDLPWVEDGLREDAEISVRLDQFNLYEKELRSMNWPYVVIKGSGDARMINAIDAINEMRST